MFKKEDSPKAKRISVLGTIFGCFRRYNADWQGRRLGAQFRARFINRTTALLSLLWIVVSLVCPWEYLLLLLAGGGLVLSPITALLTLMHQRRHFQHAKAGRFEFLTAIRFLWIGIGAMLALVALTAAISLPVWVSTLGGLLVIWGLRQSIVWTPSWVFEFNPVEVVLYVPFGARALEHAEHRIMPPARISREWYEELRRMGVDASLIDLYQQYNCPRYMEQHFIRQVYSKLKDQKNQELAHELEMFMRDVHLGATGPQGTLQTLVAQYSQSYRQLENAHTESEKAALPVDESHNPFTDQFARLQAFFAYAASPEVRSVPVMTIHPTDHVWVIWNKSQYLWIEAEVKNIKTEDSAAFDMHLTFAVEYEPERVWRPMMRNRQITLALEADREINLATREDMQNAAFNANDTADTLKREFERQKKTLGSIANRITRECFGNMKFEDAISRGISEFYGKFTRKMDAMEEATGVKVLGWSIKPIITLPDSIRTSIETRIAAQNQAVGDSASLLYLKQQFGEEFDEVIRYMVARNPGAFVDASPLLKKQTGESIVSEPPEVTEDMSLRQQPPSPPERTDQAPPHERKDPDEMAGQQQPPPERTDQAPPHDQKTSAPQPSPDTDYEERLKRLRDQRPHG